MSKIEINIVAEAMKKHNVEPAKMKAVIEDLNIEAQPDPGEEKTPAIKKQYVVLLSDPAGVFNNHFRQGHEHVAWVLQIPESDATATATERIIEAAYAFNATKKGQLFPVATIGESIENIPAKLLKERDVWCKTKSPVLVIRTDNVLPK